MRLGPTSYLMLGMVALRGPSTPYDLKRAVNRSIGRIWSFPHAQFYAEPVRLAGLGLLVEAREEGGRHRRTYTITEVGRAALRRWLATPTRETMEIRDIAELQLFFSELGTTDDVVRLAQTQAALLRTQLADLEAIAERFAGRPDLARRMAPLRLGLAVYRAAVAFWTEIADDPPGPDPAYRG